jgi:hypothetical protein
MALFGTVGRPREFGGVEGHSWDLMALDSNAMTDSYFLVTQRIINLSI